MGAPRWSEQELEILQSLAGDMPWPMVPRAYNTQAGTLGLPKRTSMALQRKCDDLGILRRSTGEWVTTGFVSKLMGVSYSTVQRWITNGWLPYRSYPHGKHKQYYFTRESLRKLAMERPYLFGGQSESTLTVLFNNEFLAARIVTMELPPPWCRRPVVCVERGRRYPSVYRAAKAVYVTPQRLRQVLDTNCTAAGYHWKTALR
jgi:hypothetical protein